MSSLQRECAWAIQQLKRCCEKTGKGSLHCSFGGGGGDEASAAAPAAALSTEQDQSAAKGQKEEQPAGQFSVDVQHQAAENEPAGGDERQQPGQPHELAARAPGSVSVPSFSKQD